jgi:hypothetical protein
MSSCARASSRSASSTRVKKTVGPRLGSGAAGRVCRARPILAQRDVTIEIPKYSINHAKGEALSLGRLASKWCAHEENKPPSPKARRLQRVRNPVEETGQARSSLSVLCLAIGCRLDPVFRGFSLWRASTNVRRSQPPSGPQLSRNRESGFSTFALAEQVLCTELVEELRDLGSTQPAVSTSWATLTCDATCRSACVGTRSCRTAGATAATRRDGMFSWLQRLFQGDGLRRQLHEDTQRIRLPCLPGRGSLRRLGKSQHARNCAGRG